MKFSPLVIASIVASAFGAEPNPPAFPDSVKVFTESTSSDEIASAVNSAFEQNGGDPTTSCNNGEQPQENTTEEAVAKDSMLETTG